MKEEGRRDGKQLAKMQKEEPVSKQEFGGEIL